MDKLELADIATNEKRRLHGFKVLGVFPFYLKFITTRTHIKLCKVKELIKGVSGEEPKINDFYNAKIQAALVPLIEKYIIIGLINDRPLSWLTYFFLKQKLKRCGQQHIWNLFLTIQKLDEPAFFLSYWKLILQEDHTLLKELKQS